MATTADDSAERLLRDADLQAERSVSIARMLTGLMLFLAVSLLLDAKDLLDPATREVTDVAKITLLALSLAGLVAYLSIRTGFWRPWMAFLTVTFDSLALLVNVLVGLRASGLPGDFVPAFPATSVLILILVTSTLRLRPMVQAYSGALLLSGLLYVGFIGGHQTYEERLAHYGIMAPFFGENANTIRFLTTLGAASVLVLAAVRGRRLLLRAVEETRRRVNLGRYLPAELAPILATSRIDEMKAGRRSRVALMFVDIRDSTAIEERLEPAALSALINAFRARVTRVALAHNGIIDKFIGDGAFLVFGVLESRPDDAANAVACARALLAEIDDMSGERIANNEAPLRIGIGVHYGEAFIGALGNEERLEFTVLGDTVNVAARLEQATKDYGSPLLVSEEALTAAGEDLGGWCYLGDERLRGRSQPVGLYALRERQSPVSRGEAFPAS